MLNEERVKHMTKMAIFEKNEAQKMAPAMKYSRKDYLSVCRIAHIFLGTAVYIAAALVVVMVLFSSVLTNISSSMIVIGGLVLLLLYVLYMYVYLRHIKARYNRRYTEGHELVKELRGAYRTLERMYESEERNKSPMGWEET